MTVKQNGIVQRYDRLGPDERFRVAMEAGARDDDQSASGWSPRVRGDITS